MKLLIMMLFVTCSASEYTKFEKCSSTNEYMKMERKWVEFSNRKNVNYLKRCEEQYDVLSDICLSGWVEHSHYMNIQVGAGSRYLLDIMLNCELVVYCQKK
jgi:hypothetical protein